MILTMPQTLKSPSILEEASVGQAIRAPEIHLLTRSDIESTAGTFWLVGTAVEHHVLYQYQLSGTKNIFASQLQTETP